ncbi:MAG: hypothetical protein JXB24_05890 [Bacteroidales bacterium]|nr:hypothetical protein [Bacteroidales bacterium]
MSSTEIKTIRDSIAKTSYGKYKKSSDPYVTSTLSKSPFYRQLLENYLGKSYTNEMYNDLFDEVARDVDFRIKQMNLQSIIN